MTAILISLALVGSSIVFAMIPTTLWSRAPDQRGELRPLAPKPKPLSNESPSDRMVV